MTTKPRPLCLCGRPCQFGYRCSTSCQNRWPVPYAPVLRGESVSFDPTESKRAYVRCKGRYNDAG